MALAMSRPWKHPKTGIYWLRKRVPDDLKALIGKGELLRSLKTRDPAEAKRLLAETLVEVDRQWTNLRAGPQTLTRRQAHEIADEHHEAWLEQFSEDPSQQTFWRTDLYPLLWKLSDSGVGSIDWGGKDTVDRFVLQGWCEDGAKSLLAARGLLVDEASRLRLAKAVATATQRASLTLAAMAHGSYEAGPIVPIGRQHVASASSARPPLRFDDVVDGWAAEKKPVEKTVYEWRRVLKHLAAFLGHEDARRVTPDNLIEWKTSMLAAGRRAKTIRDAQIAPVRAVFR